jgi:hypothetical protein
MLKHKHTFKYEVLESGVQGLTPHSIELKIEGSATLTEVLEKIESYLIAVGFVPKKNSYLDFVSREE